MTPVRIVLGITLASLLLGACAQQPAEPEPSPTMAGSPYALQCKDPRPEICTKEYRPVCAVRDNGVRCVTTPCDSTDRKTYGNGCSACSDEAVFGYNDGRCESES